MKLKKELGKRWRGPKEFDEITISIDRVSRTVAGGRRMRFKALVAIGNHKNKVGIGVAKGNDVTTAVAKATAKANPNSKTTANDELREKILEKLAENDIFIEYMYAFAEGDKANVVIRPNNITECCKVLENCDCTIRN